MFVRKSNRKNPEIPTAALPDIIFILLFFFVITSQQKPVQELVDATIPTEERSQKANAEHKLYITIGLKPNTASTEPNIQFMDRIVTLAQIPKEIDSYRQTELDAASKGKQLTAYLSIDKSVNTGLVRDVEEALRNAGVYHVINLTSGQ